MTQEEIIKGNKLIAIFMRGKYHIATEGHNEDDEILFPTSPTIFESMLQRSVERLKYHIDWNWLMPVVEKIDHKGYDVFINGLYCRISDCGQSDFELESGEVKTSIEAVWETVVEFIKWFNQQK